MPVQMGQRAGIGLVRTEDDLEALRQEDDPCAQATARQLHPTLVHGPFVAVGRQRTQLRFGIEVLAYVETVSSTTLEMKKTRVLSVAIAVRLGS